MALKVGQVTKFREPFEKYRVGVIRLRGIGTGPRPAGVEMQFRGQWRITGAKQPRYALSSTDDIMVISTMEVGFGQMIVRRLLDRVADTRWQSMIDDLYAMPA